MKVNNGKNRMNVKRYIDNLVSKGKHCFLSQDLKKDLSLSDSAMWSSLSRLKKKGEVVSPVKGYYVIVPLEYRSLGTLPPEQFIPAMMKHLQIPYYIGLLSAAQRYGATHQQPQVFQVVLSKHRRPLQAGRVEVSFVMNKHLHEIPTKEFNTPRGAAIYSSPEATAVDLTAYSSLCGGLSNVLTILEELIEQMNIEAFKQVLTKSKNFPVLQRLGYMLEVIGEDIFADAVSEYLGSQYRAVVLLDTRNPNRKGVVHKRWHLLINTKLESDL